MACAPSSNGVSSGADRGRSVSRNVGLRVAHLDGLMVRGSQRSPPASVVGRGVERGHIVGAQRRDVGA